MFTGDLLFNEGHPIVWDGPISNWMAACDHIVALDVETVVPGHGAVTDKQAVRNLKAYFEFVLAESAKRAGRRHGLGGRRQRHRAGRLPRLGRVRADLRQRARRLPRPRRRRARRRAGGVFGAMQRYRLAHAH